MADSCSSYVGLLSLLVIVVAFGALRYSGASEDEPRVVFIFGDFDRGRGDEQLLKVRRGKV